jgi:hypothetical protein
MDQWVQFVIEGKAHGNQSTDPGCPLTVATCSGIRATTAHVWSGAPLISLGPALVPISLSRVQ